MDDNSHPDGGRVTAAEATPESAGDADRDDPTPHDAIGASILKEALTRARGRHQPYCVAEEPKRKYYVSNLAPTHGVTDGEEFVSQIKPNAITLDFRPQDREAYLEPLVVEFDVYYPSHPTYEEYRDLLAQSRRAAELKHDGDSSNPDDADDADSADANDPDETDLYRLDEDFCRRADIRVTTHLDLANPQDERERLTEELRDAIDDALDEATSEVMATRDIADPEDWEGDDLDLHDLSEAEFERVIATFSEVDPDDFEWAVSFGVDVRPEEVSLRLMNEPVGADEEEEGADEPHIFNPRIEVEAALDKYEFDLGPDDYRFDQFIWAKGHNCSTTAEQLDADAQEYRVATTATPSAPVFEFEYNTDYDTRFAALAGDDPAKSTLDVLEDIASGMDDYLGEWRGSRKAEFKREYGENSDELDEFLAAAANFEEEMDRFNAGIEVLRNEDDVRRAFQMMNRVNNTVHNQRHDEFEAWRLFQLVFIVSNLPGIVTRDPAPRFAQYESQYDDMAEVLWFPTGGGKTEAYLGLVLFNLFFDRMRGKDNGVTAWIRFPLRLLSRQQKQRFMEAMLEADAIRRAPEDEGGLGEAGRPFSLGYFVGSRDSPNDIGKNNKLNEDYAASREKLEDDCQHIEECPLCGSDVNVRYDETANSVYHHCAGDALADGEECVGRLPLYVTDHDIYRYTPSVLLGSLDKIAVMGMQPLFANLLGNFTTECPAHGIGYSGRCAEKHICRYDDDSEEFSDIDPGTRDPDKRDEAEYFDPIPTLHLVDEVHLLNEELGAFASHYETMYLTLCEKLQGVTPKVLTSTATISEYERQIRNLFQMEATRFPEEGPTLGETFYGEHAESDVEREYHGLTPNNRTHLYAVLDLVKLYHEVIRDYYGMDPEAVAADAGLDPDAIDDLDDTIASVLDAYETSLVYFTNKREKDTYRKNIRKQINDEMREEGYEPPLESRQLTADTRDDDTLPRLEREGEFADDPFEERIDTVPATAFVGHGIDVDRFNFMLFFGYPSQTFQYIQASSRVGRKSGVPGHVLDVFRPFDKRDRHRYKYFEKLHEYLSRTVEPVPIDRWAKFAIEQTFPGILMALLIQYYRPLMYRKTEGGDPITITARGKTKRANVQNADHLYEMMNNDARFPELTKSEVYGVLADAFALRDRPTYLGYTPTDADGNPGLYTNAYFEERVEEYLDDIWRHWNDKLDTEMTTPAFPDDDGPMISLRDIGKSAKITNHSAHEDFIDALTQA